MKLNFVLDWALNVIVVAALPARMGFSGAPLWIFLVYALVTGIIMTLAEDVGYAREVFIRSDVRNYLKVRIAIVAVGGLTAFLIGHALTL